MEGVGETVRVGICVAVIAEVADPPPVMGTPDLEGVGDVAPEKLQACKASRNTETSESFKTVFNIVLFIKVLLWLSVKM